MEGQVVDNGTQTHSQLDLILHTEDRELFHLHESISQDLTMHHIHQCRLNPKIWLYSRTWLMNRNEKEKLMQQWYMPSTGVSERCLTN